MSPSVMGVVLLGALLHAGWNAAVKSGSDKLLDTLLVAGGTAVAGAAVLAALGPPARASWPYVAASAAIHVGYYLLVASAYARGDLSLAYPLMRGAAPLVVALASAAVFGERLGAVAWAGVLLLCAGVLLLAPVAQLRRGSPAGGPAAALALANAAVIAAYTCVDGRGVRASAGAAAYTASVFVFTFPPLLLCVLLRRSPAAALRHARARWGRGLAGGAATLAAYGASLWAMTRAPVAAVAALRETSILLGVGIGAVALGERFGPVRWIAALAIAAGAMALRAG